MSWDKSEIGAVPEATRRVAQAAFPKGTLYMQMRDELGVLFEEGDFKALYARVGQHGYPAWRLVLGSLMPFNEGLGGPDAAEAGRGGVGWKVAFGWGLEDAGS